MDRFFGLDKVSAHDAETALLVTVHDEVEKNLICGILEEEQIPYLCKDRGSGEVARILTGFSLFGCDIFVPQKAYDAAAELLDAYRNGEPVEEDFDESEAEVDD